MENSEVFERLLQASGQDLSLLESVSQEAERKNRIPKIINFCFLDYRNMTDRHLKYLKTWFEVLDDSWTFVNWTPELIKPVCEVEEYFIENNKFSFYADYVRCARVYRYGGVYLDCDVNVWKPFDPLLDLDYVFDNELDSPYMDCAVFMAKPGNRFLGIAKDAYETKKPFDYVNNPLSFLVTNFWVKALKDKGVTVYPQYIETIDEYSEALSSKNENSLFILDGTYLSCPCRYCSRMGMEVTPTEKTFCSHMFENTWSY